MRRRDVIALLASGALAWPLVGRAQPTDRMRRIGVLVGMAGDEEGQLRVSVFQQRLRDLGWIEGKNVVFDVRWGSGNPNLVRAHADDLSRLAPDVILSASGPSALALHSATNTIPVVFTVVTDPVRLGLLATPTMPEGNLTGFTNFELSMGGKWLEIIRELAPNITKLGIIFDPANALAVRSYYQASIDAAARLLGLELIDRPIRAAADIEHAVADLARHPNVGVLVLPDNTTVAQRELLAASMAKHRLPAIYPYRYFARCGGLASYGVDTVDQFRQAAKYVDRILRGWKLADLPVQPPTKFEFVLNLKAAKALELDISSSLIARADEVIE